MLAHLKRMCGVTAQLQCPFCSFHSKQRSNLKLTAVYCRQIAAVCLSAVWETLHVAAEHVSTPEASKPQQCACPQCGKHYKWRRNMLAHLKRECGVTAQLQCPFCSYRSKQRSNLKTHLGSQHSFILGSQDIDKIVI
ncbi:hypothetical protein J6590_014696 [Homalodisca vitripennis]|nr:hypothetical protein J6590_014696 [Homalodisca vitripennis]